MGFENRDYARAYEPSRGGGGGFASWEVWKKILAANIAVFLLQIIITRPATVDDFRIRESLEDELAWQDELEAMETSTSEDSADLEQEVKEEQSLADKVAEQEKLRELKRKILMKQLLASSPRISVIQDWFELDSAKVLRGQVWRLVTSGFCHDRMGIWHLLMNMLFLFWFGSRLEAKYGSEEFLAFYFAGLISASLAFMALDLFSGDGIPAIGASGAVWAITALFALLYPYDRIYVYFLFPVQIRFLVLVYFAFDLHPVLLQLGGEGFNDGIAHAAHVGGAVFGFLYWQKQWYLTPFVRRFRGMIGRLRGNQSGNGPASIRMFGGARSARSDREERRRQSVDVDVILKKISDEGYDSLTDEELRTLEDHSKRVREQRGEG